MAKVSFTVGTARRVLAAVRAIERREGYDPAKRQGYRPPSWRQIERLQVVERKPNWVLACQRMRDNGKGTWAPYGDKFDVFCFMYDVEGLTWASESVTPPVVVGDLIPAGKFAGTVPGQDWYCTWPFVGVKLCNCNAP